MLPLDPEVVETCYLEWWISFMFCQSDWLTDFLSLLVPPWTTVPAIAVKQEQQQLSHKAMNHTNLQWSHGVFIPVASLNTEVQATTSVSMAEQLDTSLRLLWAVHSSVVDLHFYYLAFRRPNLGLVNARRTLVTEVHCANSKVWWRRYNVQVVFVSIWASQFQERVM